MTSDAVYTFKKDIVYDEQTRISDLTIAIERGNNASAKVLENIKELRKDYTKKVELGWMVSVLRNINQEND